MHVTSALNSLRSGFGMGNYREQKRSENPDNGDDDQELNQRERTQSFSHWIVNRQFALPTVQFHGLMLFRMKMVVQRFWLAGGASVSRAGLSLASPHQNSAFNCFSVFRMSSMVLVWNQRPGCGRQRKQLKIR
jgi:hypothetical protein